MTDARKPRHEYRDGDEGSSSNWREMYAALNADPNRPSRRRRRAAEEAGESPPATSTSAESDAPEASPEPPAPQSAQQPSSDSQLAEPPSSGPQPTEPQPAEPPSSEQPTVRETIPAWQDALTADRERAAQPHPEPVETREPEPADADETEPAQSREPEPTDARGPEPTETGESEPTQTRRPQTPWPAELTGPEFGEPEPDEQPTSPEVPDVRGETEPAPGYVGASPYRPRGDSSDSPDPDEAPTAEQPAVPADPAYSSTDQPASADQHPSPTQPPGPAETVAASGSGGTGAGGSGDDGAPRRTGSRHAAQSSGLRMPKWAIAVAALVVVGLLAWLVIGLATGGDDDQPAATSSATTTASPTSLSVADLSPVICTGASYAFINTGQSAEQMLADPGSLEAQYPDASLATVPGGCIAGSTATDEVVLALGPFTTIDEACAAGRELGGAPFTAYAGTATTGLTETACP